MPGSEAESWTLLGDDQVNPRHLDGVHLVDAARQFVLESALVIDLLREFGLANVSAPDILPPLQRFRRRSLGKKTTACCSSSDRFVRRVSGAGATSAGETL